MFVWQSAFVPSDRVLIIDGPLHGYSGTVLNAPEPGWLTLVLDGFHEHNKFMVADTDVELDRPGQPLLDQFPHV